MRTAYLNRQAALKKPSHPREPRESIKLEAELLDGGTFDKDPFRMLKVSDFMPVGNVKTRIVYAVNEKKRPNQFTPRGPLQILEVIEPGSIFQGTVRIGEPENGAGIATPLSKKIILDSLRSFYEKEKDRENQELISAALDANRDFGQPRGWLIRLGRHSGAESMTIEGHRKITILKARGEKPGVLDHATTFWMAAEEPKPRDRSSLIPFGWTVLHEMDAGLKAEFSGKEAAWRKAHAETIKATLAEAEHARRSAAEEERKRTMENERRVQEERERQEAEARRKAELDSMSPEERAISRVTRKEITEEEVVDLFNRLEEFPNHKAIAQALKQYYIDAGKWERKDCSKKQRQKVKKIKELLGES